MKKLIDEPHEHNYVWLKNEVVTVPIPHLKILKKDIYVCVDCGSGLDVYDLDEPLSTEQP
jgi:hypothetical protein